MNYYYELCEFVTTLQCLQCCYYKRHTSGARKAKSNGPYSQMPFYNHRHGFSELGRAS